MPCQDSSLCLVVTQTDVKPHAQRSRHLPSTQTTQRSIILYLSCTAGSLSCRNDRTFALSSFNTVACMAADA